MKSILSILFSFSSLVLLSQSQWGGWFGAAAEGELHKDWKAGMEIQSRFDKNFSSLDQLYLSPFVKWDVHKHLRIGADYRWTSFGSTVSSHRGTLDLQFRDLMDLIANDSRLAWTCRLRGTYESSNYQSTETNLRLRSQLSYNLPKTKAEPFIQCELFYHFNDQLIYTFEEVRAEHNFSKYRIRIGAELPLNKRHEFQCYYMFQSRISEPKIDHVIGIEYKYNLDLKK